MRLVTSQVFEQGDIVGRRKKQAAAAEVVEPVIVEEKKGHFLRNLLFLGLLAGVGFAVFKFRQSQL